MKTTSVASTVALVGMVVAALGCSTTSTASDRSTAPCLTDGNVAVRRILLAGLDDIHRGERAGSRYAEISAMAWHGDDLWLLPQFPERLARRGAGGYLLSIPRAEIEAVIDGRSPGPITPRRVGMRLGAASSIPGSEGFESLAIDGNEAWVTVETATPPWQADECNVTHRAGSVILHGTINVEGGLEIDANPTPESTLPVLAPLSNTGYEAVVLTPDGVAALFEANGTALGAVEPEALFFPRALGVAPRRVRMPRIEYRITDATPTDAQGNFWVPNYFFPGDYFLAPGDVPATNTVEQLIELHWSTEGVTRTARPPVVLRLGNRPRNWEGVARLPGRGLLIVTDEWPDTMLAFVPVSSP